MLHKQSELFGEADNIHVAPPREEDCPVIVVSKRVGGTRPRVGDKVVPCDRTHPVLGNRHILRNHLDPVQRAKVIASYKVDLEEDFAVKGPKYQCCVDLAAQVKAGTRIALECWCAEPRGRTPCHGDLIKEKILDLARQ